MRGLSNPKTVLSLPLWHVRETDIRQVIAQKYKAVKYKGSEYIKAVKNP